jgi:hypothetical protein
LSLSSSSSSSSSSVIEMAKKRNAKSMKGDVDKNNDEEEVDGGGRVTRAKAKASGDDRITYYTKILPKNSGGKKIEVVSKKPINMSASASDDYHGKLREKFERIDNERVGREERREKANRDANVPMIMMVTHFNTFMYAACFFIQVGTMPVRNHY